MRNYNPLEIEKTQGGEERVNLPESWITERWEKEIGYAIDAVIWNYQVGICNGKCEQYADIEKGLPLVILDGIYLFVNEHFCEDGTKIPTGAFLWKELWKQKEQIQKRCEHRRDRLLPLLKEITT